MATTDPFYEAAPAGDGTSLTPPQNAEFQVFEEFDTARANPLPLRTSAGTNAAPLVTTAQGVLPAVYVASPNTSHIFKSGEWEFVRHSITGMKADAVNARIAAEKAAATAEKPADQAVSEGIARADIPGTVAKTVAAQPAVVAAAAAAVDANPRILEIEARSAQHDQRLISLITDGPHGAARNIILNAGPHSASPAWFSAWGTGGNGTREFVPDPSAPSKIAYIRHTWTAAATSTAALVRSVASPASGGTMYSGSIWVRTSIPNVLGATLSFYDTSGTQLGTNVYNRLYRAPANQWTRLDVNGFTAPAGTTRVRVGAAVNSAGVVYSAGDTLDVSAALVAEGSRVFDYFDGDQPNAYWEADPGASPAVAAVPEADFGAPFTKAPTHAGPRTGRYSRAKRLYLPLGTDLGPLRRRIGQALDGENALRLAWLGHSIVAGQGGAPGLMDNVRLFQQRAAQAGDAVTGMVPAVNNTTTDARVTFDPEWESVGAPRSNMQLHRRCLTPGKKYTYASNTPGTVVDIYTFGNGSAVTYSIDGSAPVTLIPSGASTIQITTVGGLANTNHAVTITSTSSTATYLLGVGVHNLTGLEVSNFGYSGSWAADWRSDYFSTSQRFYNGYNDVFANWGADAAIIELGANELIHGSTAATLESNLAQIVSAATSAGKDTVLVLGTPVEDATRKTWVSDYCPAVYNVADAHRVPLVDLTAHWISRPVAAARDFYADQWHPNARGYYDLHEVMARALLP